MADGAARFGQGSSGPALLRVPAGRHGGFAYGAITPSGAPFQALPLPPSRPDLPALLPRARLDARGLGSSPFARRYSGSHCCFPFLRLLRCFSSPGSPPLNADAAPPARRVAPFGHPRVKGRSRLTAAFRSLPRPSSPPGAKASPVRPPVLVAYRARPPRHRGVLEYPSSSLAARCCGLLLLVIVYVSFLILSKNLRPGRGKWRTRESNP